MAKGNIHSLGLGIIKCITTEIENDNNVSGIYDIIEPVAKDMLQEYFPNPNVNIHPLVDIGFKLFNKKPAIDQKIIVLGKDRK